MSEHDWRNFMTARDREKQMARLEWIRLARSVMRDSCGFFVDAKSETFLKQYAQKKG